MSNGWIGVDLDGTLARYDGWKGIEHVGAPIMPMVERVKRWLSGGMDVRIMTARVYGEMEKSPSLPQQSANAKTREAIETWCLEHVGRVLPITCTKDYGMIELWDDRAVQVEPNTGRRMDGLEDEDFIL